MENKLSDLGNISFSEYYKNLYNRDMWYKPKSIGDLSNRYRRYKPKSRGDLSSTLGSAQVMGGMRWKGNKSKDDPTRESKIKELKALLSFVNSSINSISEEIKSLVSEDIKVYRIHKEGEKIGMITLRNEIQSRLDKLENSKSNV